jgi:hypothetical protein
MTAIAPPVPASADKMGFEQLERELNSSNEIRTRVITKLVDALDKKQITLDGKDSEDISFAVGALTSLLNGKDASHINIVKLRLTLQKNDIDADSSKLVNEFLKTVKLTSAPASAAALLQNKAEADKKVSDAFDATGGAITDAEASENDT